MDDEQWLDSVSSGCECLFHKYAKLPDFTRELEPLMTASIFEASADEGYTAFLPLLGLSTADFGVGYMCPPNRVAAVGRKRQPKTRAPVARKPVKRRRDVLPPSVFELPFSAVETTSVTRRERSASTGRPASSVVVPRTKTQLVSRQSSRLLRARLARAAGPA